MSSGLPRIIPPSTLEPGDVLVGYSRLYAGEYGGETRYSHAAIYLGSDDVLESDGQGVQITDLAYMHRTYDHLAVLRTEDPWSQHHLQRLRDFADRHVGKRFNAAGVWQIEELKEQNIATAMQQLEEYFATRRRIVSADRKLYFCSELVSAAFIDVGIIADSAALFFRPETLTPSDLIKDKAFGFFVGYVPKSNGYQIPDDDWFTTNV